MARPTSKEELLESASVSFEKLWKVIDTLTEDVLNKEFDFSDDIKKKEAHWSRDKNLKDVLIHLYEWHQLLLKWVNSNTNGQKLNFLPEPYNWKTYGDMNIEFWQKHKKTTLNDARNKLIISHKTVMEMLQPFSNDELFTKQKFDWTGTTSLGSYCISSTSSHYEWASKKIRAHIKMLAKKKYT